MDLADQSRFVLLSCFHVLGDHPESVVGAIGVSTDEGRPFVVSSRGIALDGQATVNETTAEGELTVFPIDSGCEVRSYLSIAAHEPKVGDIVYLLAQAFGEAHVRLHKAKLKAIAAGYLEYIFEDAMLELGGTSGGPMLNEQGEVIGINVSGAKLDHLLYGYANPTRCVVRQIQEALRSKGPNKALVPTPDAGAAHL
jgi:S1-C subfamily serine protease